MSPRELEEFIHLQFPSHDRKFVHIEKLGADFAQIRLPFHEGMLRPGDTVSGPTLMTLADTAMYVVVLAMIGPVALAVTTNLNINFLRKPRPADVIGRARLLKLGRRLAVGDVLMFSDGDDEPVAHATVTYSIPPGAPRLDKAENRPTQTSED
jgi:uncharacterized protein (TIGR00369 family)